MKRRRKEDWWCDKCKFKIFGWKNKCSKCGTKRHHTIEHKPISEESIKKRENQEDWWCTTCDFKIYRWKEYCSKCGKSRPNNTQSGGNNKYDWFCTTCKIKIYGFKDKCGKCGTTRPKIRPLGDISKTTPETTPSPPREISEDPSECVVCMDNKPCVVIVACGHLVLCEECCNSLNSCPICRKEFTKEQCIKVYT